MKISVSSYSFSQYITKGRLTQFSAIEAAHKIGFENIEFTDLMPPEGVTKEEYAHQLREEADRLGMGITCYAIGACMACDTEEENRAEFERVCQAVRIAKILGAPVMRHDVFSKWSDKYKNFDAVLDAMVPNIRAITSYAKALGIKTMMENHGFICQDADRVERIINAVNDENFGLLLDIGNFMCADEQSALSVSRCAHLAFHVHAKDFHYRPYETKTAEGFFRTRAQNQLKGSIIGEGAVPVEQCLSILKSKGYDGVCAIEFEGSEDCIEGITKGFNNLKQFIANLD